MCIFKKILMFEFIHFDIFVEICKLIGIFETFKLKLICKNWNKYIEKIINENKIEYITFYFNNYNQVFNYLMLYKSFKTKKYLKLSYILSKSNINGIGFFNLSKLFWMQSKDNLFIGKLNHLNSLNYLNESSWELKKEYNLNQYYLLFKTHFQTQINPIYIEDSKKIFIKLNDSTGEEIGKINFIDNLPEYYFCTTYFTFFFYYKSDEFKIYWIHNNEWKISSFTELNKNRFLISLYKDSIWPIITNEDDNNNVKLLIGNKFYYFNNNEYKYFKNDYPINSNQNLQLDSKPIFELINDNYCRLSSVFNTPMIIIYESNGIYLIDIESHKKTLILSMNIELNMKLYSREWEHELGETYFNISLNDENRFIIKLKIDKDILWINIKEIKLINDIQSNHSTMIDHFYRLRKSDYENNLEAELIYPYENYNINKSITIKDKLFHSNFDAVILDNINNYKYPLVFVPEIPKLKLKKFQVSTPYGYYILRNTSTLSAIQNRHLYKISFDDELYNKNH